MICVGEIQEIEASLDEAVFCSECVIDFINTEELDEDNAKKQMQLFNSEFKRLLKDFRKVFKDELKEVKNGTKRN